MSGIRVGDRYKANPTDRNRLNSISSLDHIRIGFLDGDYISIVVLKVDGRHFSLAVPRFLFGVNFEEDRSHLVSDPGYALSGRAKEIYK